jgi:hypothetical protein
VPDADSGCQYGAQPFPASTGPHISSRLRYLPTALSHYLLPEYNSM